MGDSVKALLEQNQVTVLRVDEEFGDKVYRIVSDMLLNSHRPRRDVLDSIIAAARSRHAQTAVVEKCYVDADYLETFSSHYSKAFRLKPSICTRIHFFEKVLAEEDILELDRDDGIKSYLGYCILRPTGDQYISRTVIVPPHRSRHATNFIHCATNFRAHLLGQPLTVRGAPFIQQDANTFICAGAALWTIAMFMHQQHSTPRYYPSQIERIARHSSAERHLRQGMHMGQIARTMHEMGLNTFVETYHGLQSLRNESPGAHKRVLARLVELLHMSTDSGLPPILAYTKGVEGHAVAVVGHDITDKSEIPQDQFSDWHGVLRNSVFVDRFFCMDDAKGPYSPIKVEGDENSLSSFDMIGVVVPVPRDVPVLYQDACQEFMLSIPIWNDLVIDLGLDDAYTIPLDPDNPVCVRPALLDSRDWKMNMLPGDIPAWVKRHYQALSLPKYIWVIEISDWNHVNRNDRSTRKIRGEAILDATANPHWPFDSVIAFHANKLLLIADQTDCNREAVYYFEESGKEYYEPALRGI